MICLVCSLGFAWRQQIFGTENPGLDGRFNRKHFLYKPSDVDTLFRNLGPKNLKIYAITELTLDVVFPIFYVLFLVFLMIRLFPADKAKYLILLPVLGGIFDLAENFTIAFLAFTFDQKESVISYLAAFFTFLKWVLLLSGLLVLLLGLILAVWTRIKS